MRELCNSDLRSRDVCVVRGLSLEPFIEDMPFFSAKLQSIMLTHHILIYVR